LVNDFKTDLLALSSTVDAGHNPASSTEGLEISTSELLVKLKPTKIAGQWNF